MVKQILKNTGLTLVQFSEDLNISRPTLDNYIKTFESGEEITNELFQNIFSFLFSSASITESEFNSKYEYIKKYYGLGSKILDEAETPEISVPVSEAMSEDREYLSLFSDYRDYVRGKRKLEALTDKEKKYFTALHKVEIELSENNSEYSQADFNQFVSCCDEHYESEHPEDFVSEIVKTKIEKIIADNKGLSIDKLLQKLKEEL